MSSLVTHAHAVMGARRVPAAPVVQRPAVTPRWPNSATAAKQAAGAKVEAAWRALLAAQQQAAEARRASLGAAIDRHVSRGQSGAHERRLAGADAERRADAAMQTLQSRQAEFETAVREFYAT
jgi:hypothetical protein